MGSVSSRSSSAPRCAGRVEARSPLTTRGQRRLGGGRGELRREVLAVFDDLLGDQPHAGRATVPDDGVQADPPLLLVLTGRPDADGGHRFAGRAVDDAAGSRRCHAAITAGARRAHVTVAALFTGGDYTVAMA